MKGIRNMVLAAALLGAAVTNRPDHPVTDPMYRIPECVVSSTTFNGWFASGTTDE